VSALERDARLAIVEDDVRYRRSLEVWLQYAEGFEAVQSFGSAESLYRELSDLERRGAEPPWDLVLMDIKLPGNDGIEATRRLKAFAPDVPVVMLTMLEDPPLILQAIGAGASGYLLKKAGTKDMLTALNGIMDGGAVLTPAVARHVLRWIREPDASTRRASLMAPELTDRECEVLTCLVDGLTYAESAERLGISFETVRTHIRNVYRKLHVQNARQAVRRALDDGLV
jgi:DNA-binding NarL/FixJ family response regulator